MGGLIERTDLKPKTKLKRVGLKAKLPRLKILEILYHKQNQYLSAEDVHNALVDDGTEIQLGTVTRVLAQFEAAGLIKRHHFDGGQAIFALDTGDSHDHIVCSNTGRIAEFKDSALEHRLHEIADEPGDELSDHSIILYGIRRS